MENLKEQLAESLFLAEAETLLSRLRSGLATHQELEVARKFLADNGITSEIKKGNTLSDLTEELPFLSVVK
jgi:hypothetical protein